MIDPAGFLHLYFHEDLSPYTLKDAIRDIPHFNDRKKFSLFHISFGHNVETAFLLHDALSVLRSYPHPHLFNTSNDVQSERFWKVARVRREKEEKEERERVKERESVLEGDKDLVLSMLDGRKTIKVCLSLIRFALTHGWDKERGGIYDGAYDWERESEITEIGRLKEKAGWRRGGEMVRKVTIKADSDFNLTIVKPAKAMWAQVELLNSLHLFSCLSSSFPFPPSETSPSSYFSFFHRTFLYIDQYVLDKESGGWFPTGSDGTPFVSTLPKVDVSSSHSLSSLLYLLCFPSVSLSHNFFASLPFSPWLSYSQFDFLWIHTLSRKQVDIWKSNYHNTRALISCLQREEKKKMKGKNDGERETERGWKRGRL